MRSRACRSAAGAPVREGAGARGAAQEVARRLRGLRLPEGEHGLLLHRHRGGREGPRACGGGPH
eukprot:13085210-Alexandrium_andersonii.AAC.1